MLKWFCTYELIISRIQALQTLNPDGTINLKVANLVDYLSDVAAEINRTFTHYSDVRIVCGDGLGFSANKSILSRHPALSYYFHLRGVESDESKIWH